MCSFLRIALTVVSPHSNRTPTETHTDLASATGSWTHFVTNCQFSSYPQWSIIVSVMQLPEPHDMASRKHQFVSFLQLWQFIVYSLPLQAESMFGDQSCVH